MVIMVLPEQEMRKKLGKDELEFPTIKKARRFIKKHGGRLKLLPKIGGKRRVFFDAAD